MCNLDREVIGRDTTESRTLSRSLLTLGGSRGLLLLLITSYMHIIIIETYLVQC